MTKTAIVLVAMAIACPAGAVEATAEQTPPAIASTEDESPTMMRQAVAALERLRLRPGHAWLDKVSTTRNRPEPGAPATTR